MPYFDVSPTDARGMFGIADDVCPAAAILVGEFSQRDCFRRVRAIWPDAREGKEAILRASVATVSGLAAASGVRPD
jgi:hypothetical protein